MHLPSRPGAARRALLALFLIAACSSDDGDGGGPPTDELEVAKAAPSGDAQTGTVGEGLADPLRVVVTLDGAPEAGRTVNWTALDGSVNPTSGTTDASGIAETAWTLGGGAGGQGARATVASATGSPVDFTATAAAGPATNLVEVSGDNQTGRVSTATASPLVVRVEDAFDNPVAGVAVTFAVTAGDATVATPNPTSGANGQAQTVINFGTTAGSVDVIATSGTLTGSPVTFGAESAHVIVVNDQFSLNSVTVSAGTTVRWVWSQGAVGHNITPVGGTEPTATPSANNSAPFSYEHTFNTPGEYDYQCTNHPPGMTGTITVQ
jgi:plastocyanin